METESGERPAALKKFYLDTPLVKQRQPKCAIAAPSDPDHQGAARRLARGLKDLTGAEIPIQSGAVPDGRTVIALGKMVNNPLIERLYWSHYTFADGLWPGADGWAIQTVHNPYPWANGHNVLLLAGSSAAGVESAVKAFLSDLEPGTDLSIPHTLRVQLPDPALRNTRHGVLGRTYSEVCIPEGDLTDQEADGLKSGVPAESLLAFQEHAARLLLTGHPAYGVAARNVLLRMCELYEAEPGRKMTWPEQTNSRSIFAMWDAVEEADAFSDEDRLRITRMLLCFLQTLVGVTSDYGSLEDNDTIVWNHTTFPLMGLYWGGRYFRRYYGLKETDAYLAKAAGAFRGQEKSWKPQCDADSYLVLTIGHTIEYALAEGRMGFFDTGNIRTYADYLMGICDNLGRAPGFGDSGLVRDNRIPLSGVPYAFWYTADPQYLGWLNAVSGGKWPNPYHPDVEPEPPERLAGVRAYPLDRQVYDFTARRPYYAEPSGPPNVPYEQAFDKVTFRSGLDPDDQFFILDGYARGKHLHYDGNAILKLTQQGEDWLIDADYLVRNTTEHNMISVVRDGRVTQAVPECAGLLHLGDLPTYGFTQTVVRDYNGVDWYRDIVWKKGGWIAVLDRLNATGTADYAFDAVWKVLDDGEIGLDGAEFSVVRELGNDGQPWRFCIQNASGAAATLRRRTGTPGPVRMLVQRQAARLEDGDSLAVQNLLQVSPQARSGGLRLTKVDESSALLSGEGRRLLGAGRLAADGILIEAAVYCIADGHVAACGVRRMEIGGIQLRSKTPVSVEVNAATGETILHATKKAEVARRGESPLQILPGSHRIVVRCDGEETRLLRSLLADRAQTAPGADIQQSQSDASGGGLDPVWVLEPDPEPEEIRSVVRWLGPDRPGDPAGPKLLVCQGRKVKCYGQGGVINWTFSTSALVRCVAVNDVDGDGRLEILCGGDDEYVHVLDDQGRERRNHRMAEQLIVGQGGTTGPSVNCLLAEDIDGDGQIEILVGCTNSQLSAFDSAFNRLWNRGGIYHGVRKLTAARMAEGEDTLVLASDHYGSVHLIGPAGDYLGRAYSELGDVAFDVGDLDGDGRLEVVNGSGTGVAAAYGEDLNELWQFNNHGYNHRQVVCRDVDGDGMEEALIASDTGYVYALKGDGSVLWQANLGSPVYALSAIESGSRPLMLAAGLASGETVVINTQGQPRTTRHGSAPVKLIYDAGSDDEGLPMIVVADTDERLTVLAPSTPLFV